MPVNRRRVEPIPEAYSPGLKISLYRRVSASGSRLLRKLGYRTQHSRKQAAYHWAHRRPDRKPLKMINMDTKRDDLTLATNLGIVARQSAKDRQCI